MKLLKTMAAALAASTIAGSAFAADLPSRKVAPAYIAPAPVFTWTGFYLGLNAGYAWDSTAYATSMLPGSHLGALANVLSVSASGTGAGSRGGFTGGAQAGFNYQMGMFVAGVETDIAFVPKAFSLNGSGILTTGNPYLINHSINSGVFGTVRGRLGVAFDRALIYATGGLAYRTGNYSWNYFDTLFAATGGASAGLKLGWTIGGGVEYAFAPNWTVKAEYLHSDFGTVDTTGIVVSTTGGVNVVSTSARHRSDLVRLGVNYKFGWGGAPVVAKY